MCKDCKAIYEDCEQIAGEDCCPLMSSCCLRSECSCLPNSMLLTLEWANYQISSFPLISIFWMSPLFYFRWLFSYDAFSHYAQCLISYILLKLKIQKLRNWFACRMVEFIPRAQKCCRISIYSINVYEYFIQLSFIQFIQYFIHNFGRNHWNIVFATSQWHGGRKQMWGMMGEWRGCSRTKEI